jgi:hypothetical protein
MAQVPLVDPVEDGDLGEGTKNPREQNRSVITRVKVSLAEIHCSVDPSLTGSTQKAKTPELAVDDT